MKKKTARAFLVVVAVILMMAAVACKAETAAEIRYASVTFSFSSAAFSAGNVENYRIQYRAIPLFGDSTTTGRATNWTDIEETESGSGNAQITVQTGNWIFYARVSDTNKTFIDTCTGTYNVQNNCIIRIDTGDEDLTGYGEQQIYIRADYVYEGQTLLIEYEDSKTGTVITIDQTDTEIVKNNRASVDYYLTTGQLPAANYIVTAKILGEGGTVIMSKQTTAEVRSTGTDALIMKISTESAVDGSLIIVGGDSLDGYIKGPSEIEFGEEAEYKFYPANTYTTENTVWYYWYADGTRYSTKETTLKITFPNPGQYSVSCIPVGINGEVLKASRQVDVEMKTTVNSPSESEL